MQRNNDLIREILLYVEKHQRNYNDGIFSNDIELEDYYPNEINYHCLVLFNAGFFEGRDCSSDGDPNILINAITWQGHELIETIREKSFWEKIKSTAIELKIPLTTETIISVAKFIMAKALAT